MNKVITVFIIISSIAQGSRGQAIEYSITHDQYYVLPENALDGWYVGIFHENISDKYLFERTGEYSFSIISGNTNNAFAIDSSSGLITVNNRAAFYKNGTTNYILDIEVAVDTTGNVAKAYILVKDSTECHFIDMDANISGNGTLQSPYKCFNDISEYEAGEVAFIKRGSVGGPEEIVSISGTFTEEAPFRVAAYGVGNKPLIVNTNTHNNGVNLGNSYIYVYDLETRNFNGNREVARNGFRFSDFTKGNKAFRCESSKSSGNGEFYIRVEAEAVLMDCRGWDNVSSHIFKLEGSYDTLISCSAINAPNGNGFSVPCGVNGTHGYIVNSYACGPFESGCVYIRKPNVTVAYNYLTNSYRIISTDELAEYESADNLHIHHNILDNPDGQYGFRAHKTDSLIFEDNIIRGCNEYEKAIFIYNDCKNVQIRRNKIYNNELAGIYIEGSGQNDISISYNLIYNSTTGVSIQKCGPNIRIFNNTIVKNTENDVINVSGTDVEFRNNIYEYLTFTNLFPNSNNASLEEGSPFIDYDNNDFRLASSPSPFINAGYDYGDAVDLAGNVVPQGAATDIGAYEFLETTSLEYHQLDGVKIYPVPLKNELNLSELPQECMLSVFDLSGKMLMQNRIDKGEGNINLQKLNSGIYVLKVYFASGIVKSLKFIKE